MQTRLNSGNLDIDVDSLLVRESIVLLKKNYPVVERTVISLKPSIKNSQLAACRKFDVF